MKKILLLFIITITSCNSSFKSEEFSLVGKWKAEIDKEDIGYLIFQEDGYAYIQIGNEIMGGKGFEKDGIKGFMTYTVDYTKKPLEIDFNLGKIESKEEIKLIGIAKIITNDKIRMEMEFGIFKPTKEADNSIIYNRVE